MQSALAPLLAQLADGADLTAEQSTRAFQIVMNGGATPAQIAALLMALRLKGETPAEIIGGATAIRAKAARFTKPGPCMDTCGTGGDGKGSLNVSTAVAFVLAACDVRVAKHGNRAVSSKSGSADVLEAMGVRIDAPQAVMERALAETQFCFLFAPLYHKAMRHVAPVRQELGIRTIFNLLGPLSNPALPEYQLLGVYHERWVEPMAHVLLELGVASALVVYGRDGMDELTLAQTSLCAQVKDGSVTTFELSPEHAGIAPNSTPLTGGDANENAGALRRFLMSEKNAYRDAVLYNAAAALVVAGQAGDLPEGAERAREAVDSGRAHDVLQRFILASRAEEKAHA